MTVEQAVLERALVIAGVAALVGTRGYLLKLPQGPTLPAIRVQLIDEELIAHLRGGGATGRSRVQVDIYAHEASGSDPYAVATAVAAAVHGDGSGAGLDGWHGLVDTLTITGILRVDRAVSYEAAELRLVRVRQDYMVGWKR